MLKGTARKDLIERPTCLWTRQNVTNVVVKQPAKLADSRKHFSANQSGQYTLLNFLLSDQGRLSFLGETKRQQKRYFRFCIL